MSVIQTLDTPPLTGVIHAAGAVVWRENDGRFEVALVHRPRYRDWSWPKGKLDPGESVPAGAVREVAEEIGTPVVLGVPLPTLRYKTPEGRSKHVRYWAARPATEEDAPAVAARGPVERAPLTEIDDVVWVSAATAADMLTRKTDRAPLTLVEELWQKGRLESRVLAVTRHGQARRRASHPGSEGTRPLTEAGKEQVEALVPVLAAFGVRQVLTSPWERCVRTVEPYATQTGVPVEVAEALTETGHAIEPGDVAALVRARLRNPEDAVVCTHRPVLPTVLRTVKRGMRPWSLGELPRHDPYLRPGETLVAHVSGRGDRARVIAVERHRPPQPAEAV